MSEEVKEAPKKKGMCKCPVGSPQKGDKDPAVLAWHKKYRKDLYASKGMDEFVKKNKIKLN